MRENKSVHYDLDPEVHTNHCFFIDIGFDYRLQGKYDLAIKFFQKAIDIDPEYVSAYNGLGDTYFNQGKYDLVIESYQKAIAIDPNDAGAYYGLGSVYSIQDKKALCAEYIRKAISLDLAADNIELELEGGVIITG